MAVASCLSAWVCRPRRAACERRPAAIVYNYTILFLCDKLSRYAFGLRRLVNRRCLHAFEPHCYHCRDALLPMF